MANKKTEYSIQYLENLSADLGVSPPVLRRGLVGKDSSGNYYNVAVSETGEIGNNSQIEYDYSDPTSIVIQKTIGTDTYQQTITISGSVATEGAWIKL